MRYKKFLSILVLLTPLAFVCALWIYGYEALGEIGAGIVFLGFILGYRGDLGVLEAFIFPSFFAKGPLKWLQHHSSVKKPRSKKEGRSPK
jgi:hypothetical protein